MRISSRFTRAEASKLVGELIDAGGNRREAILPFGGRDGRPRAHHRRTRQRDGHAGQNRTGVVRDATVDGAGGRAHSLRCRKRCRETNEHESGKDETDRAHAASFHPQSGNRQSAAEADDCPPDVNRKRNAERWKKQGSPRGTKTERRRDYNPESAGWSEGTEKRKRGRHAKNHARPVPGIWRSTRRGIGRHRHTSWQAQRHHVDADGADRRRR